LFLFCFLGNSGLWAWEYAAEQALIIGTGVGMLFGPMILDSTDEEINAYWYIGGGLFIGVGLIWMFLDIADSGSGSSGGGVPSDEDVSDFSFKKPNPIFDILKHLSFGVAPGKAYFGVNYKF